MKTIGILLAAALAPAAVGFTPGGPVSPSGAPATVDLPASQHMKNVGGSDGAGLCVFTSVEHSARWQAIHQLDGFQNWMRRRPGGGWPQKLDQMLERYCAERRVELPPYIQHTGGDESFLRLALKTDRFPCVTYAGRDDFYRSRIAHMVNLAHLDDSVAAIVDNNRPGVWLWMTRDEFLYRWRDMQGGWAVVFLDAPPPPHPEAKAQAFDALPCDGGCICGDKCKCKPGDCPAKCPVAFGQNCVGPSWGVPMSAGRPTPMPAAAPGSDYQWQQVGPSAWGWVQRGPYEWGAGPDGVWQWRLAAPQAAVAPQPQAVGGVENYGVDLSKLAGAPKYSFRGVPIDERQVQSLFGAPRGSPLADDSDRWHLSIVGDEWFRSVVESHVAKLPADVRAKLLVKNYGVGEWPVAHYKLPLGVSLRKPSAARVSADVGAVAAADYSPAALEKLLQTRGGPMPAVEPMPQPKPDEPAQPQPVPPAPLKLPPLNEILPWILAAVVAWFALRRK
jgi:hypothetical protein